MTSMKFQIGGIIHNGEVYLHVSIFQATWGLGNTSSVSLSKSRERSQGQSGDPRLAFIEREIMKQTQEGNDPTCATEFGPKTSKTKPRL
jgi:hypothetical protein